MAGLDDPEGLFQCRSLYESMILIGSIHREDHIEVEEAAKELWSTWNLQEVSSM